MREGPIFERFRYETAKRTLAKAQEVFAYPSVHKAFGGLAVELLEVSHMASVPPIRDSLLEGLDDFSKDINQFPFLFLRRKEELSCDVVGPMPAQIVKVRDYLESSEPELSERLVSEYKVIASRRTNVGELAFYDQRNVGFVFSTCPEIEIEDGPIYSLHGRPVVCVGFSSPRQELLTAVHELSHAHDYIVHPVTTGSYEDERLETELRAFMVDSVICELLFGKEYAEGRVGRLPRVVEAIRRSCNGSRFGDFAFEPNQHIKDILEKAGLTSIYT